MCKMKGIYHSLGQVHPVVGFFYFLFVFVSCFLSQNPVILLLCLCSGLLYQWVMKGLSAAVKALLMAIPMAALLVLINPLFNHNGVTPLFYVNDVPFTLEAMLYGGVTAITVINTVLWFVIANDTIDQDKVVYLFGRPFPTAALLVGMIFRLIPYLQRELQQIRFAQKGLGIGTEQGQMKERLKNGGSILLCLSGNALEHAVDTAVAMKSRGYGLPGNSRRKQYHFRKGDSILSAVIILLVVLLGWCFFSGLFYFQLLPSVSDFTWGVKQLVGYLLYLVFLNIPLLYNGKEELKWRYLHSKM